MHGISKKIIIAPLNWGLGHATRCIPIIRYLLDQGHVILVASDGAALELLKIEFPQLLFAQLPGYNIQYSKHNMYWKMAKQLPSLQRAIAEEYKSLRNILIDFNADLIISDNRYGCFNKICRSVIICHQINIPVIEFISPLVNAVHRRFLGKFDQIWIPDIDGEQKLTGKMTHKLSGLSAQFIGPISRMEQHLNIDVKDQIICVLSGPEPQRSLLEVEMINQLSKIDVPSFIIQGKVIGEKNRIVNKINNLTLINYLTSDGLNTLLQESKYIIARSGYSTIMDLIKIKRSALLIPTPGQPEQEYLARYLSDRQWMPTQKQGHINIKDYMSQSICAPLPEHSENTLVKVLSNYLHET